MDNAGNNDTMMRELDILLRGREIPFHSVDRRIMCYGHVVDLSSGRIIDGQSTVNSRSGDWDGVPLLIEPTYAEAIGRDIVSHARSVVRVIRGSGMRREAFDEVIINGNTKGWFKEGEPPRTIQVPMLQLLRDVRTRWDSEYYMLKRLRELRPVCLRIL
jgi:hypothetical protein